MNSSNNTTKQRRSRPGSAPSRRPNGNVQQKNSRLSRQQQQKYGGRGGGQSRSLPSSRNTTPTTTRRLVNGEKGAETHTVNESDRIRLTNILINFREVAEETTIEFPSTLTNTERKFVHSLCGQLGLKSKSYGKGEDRKITVSKSKIAKGGKGPNKKDGDTTVNSDELLPMLNIGVKGISALKKHVKLFPPTEVERLESYQTGSSLKKIMDKSNNNDNGDGIKNTIGNENEEAIYNVLNELGLSAPDGTGDMDNKTNYDHTTKQQQQEKKRRRQQKNWSEMQRTKKENTQYKKMVNQRSRLPAYQMQNDICTTIENNTIIVISGETGCGKSTQIPQFILDNIQLGPSANIIVTQPRRLSAISLCERVSSEQCCSDKQMTIGYQVRLEKSYDVDKTQCLFVTPGILLKKLQSSPLLEEFNYIIIDEIHERDRYTEFLLIILRDLIIERNSISSEDNKLRIILMSATLQTKELINYWQGINNCSYHSTGGLGEEPEEKNELLIQEQQTELSLLSLTESSPVEINIPGRTFPVQEFFLEDILSMTNYLQKIGGFGSDDMNQLEDDIAALFSTGNNSQQQKGRTKQKGGRGRSNYSKKQPAEEIEPGLVCVMCQKSTFTSPEELGTHVALCDGGGGGDIEMDVLEERVRNASCTLHSMGFINNKNTENDDAIFEEYSLEDESGGTDDDNGYGDDDDALGLVEGKWDGTSPFAVTASISSSSQTLTEEQILNQYQSLHDDEQIDDTLILEIIEFIVKSSFGDGAILIFLPGWQEISDFTLLLESSNHDNKYLILPLHSGISSKDQRKVFQRPPPGVRKVILSTNIAETSLTIDDVSFVIDTGRAKEKSYDPHLKTSTLQPVWISQASVKQRSGRAGRTKAGVCFRLFSRRRHSSMRQFTESELLRTPLEEMCLQCKKLNLTPGGSEDFDGIPAFLAKSMTPPHPKSISNALDLLVDLGAMDGETNDLTPLGKCLSVLSLEPRVGKMVIYSHLLGVAKSVSSLGVAMSYKSPFIMPPSHMRKAADSAKVELSNNTESDQITVYHAMKKRQDCYKRNNQGSFNHFCRKYFLSTSTMTMINDLQRNLHKELAMIGFPNTLSIEKKTATNDGSYRDFFHNRHERESDIALWQASIAAGLYPNIAFRKRGEINFSTMDSRKAKIHLSSVNAIRSQPLGSKSQVSEGEVEYVVFGELVRGVGLFTMSQTTHLASPLPLILLCGNILNVRPAIFTPTETADTIDARIKHSISVLSLDDWVVFACDSEVASNLVILRKRLEKAFLSITSNPNNTLLTETERNAVETIGVVIKSAHQASSSR